MKIEAKPIKTEIKSEVQIANYLAEDIKKLIAADLAKRGHTLELSNILLVAKWKYIEDGREKMTHMIAKEF